MIDIQLAKKIHASSIQKERHRFLLYKTLENQRNRTPAIYQIETTNACNMKCVMCPRPNLVTRKTGHMDMRLYRKILGQINEIDEDNRKTWTHFYRHELLPLSHAPQEDRFFYEVCSTSLILHGYGEPVLDPYIVDRVNMANNQNLQTYFSMNPVNINIGQIEKICRAGLSFLKFSLDGMDNDEQRKYRGQTDGTFDTTIQKILEVLAIIDKFKLKTKIIVTKLNFNNNSDSNHEFIDFWKKFDLFYYIKNQERKWLYQEKAFYSNTAHYMQNPCFYPWLSMCVLHDGTVTPCSLDYNGEISLGNCEQNSLSEIWNGKDYNELREMHIYGNFPKNHFCTNKCETPKWYEKIERQKNK